MATSSLAEIETGHSLGLAYLSDIPQNVDSIAAGANITITTVGTVNTIAATVPIQTITNGQNISVAYDSGTKTETITGVSYLPVGNYWDTGASTQTLTSKNTAYPFVSATTHTIFSGVPTANWTGMLATTIDLQNPQVIINMSTATAPQPISISFGLYVGDLATTNQILTTPATICLQTFTATGTANQWYASGYWDVAVATKGGGITTVNPAVSCYVSFTTADTTVVSVVLPTTTRFSVYSAGLIVSK